MNTNSSAIVVTVSSQDSDRDAKLDSWTFIVNLKMNDHCITWDEVGGEKYHKRPPFEPQVENMEV
jgi:hypothetical protein